MNNFTTSITPFFRPIFIALILLCFGFVSEAAAPTVQSSTDGFDSLRSNFLSFKWKNGNGEKRIVVVRAGSPVSFVPVNGVEYSENSTFGAGTEVGPLGEGNYVVKLWTEMSQGTSRNVKVTNLSPNTVYYFAVFEYNGVGLTTEYLTPGAITSKSTVVNPPSTSASNLTVGSITPTSASISWTGGNGAKRLVIAKQGSAVDKEPSNGVEVVESSFFGIGDQISGNYFVYNDAANSFTLSGLSQGTKYHLAVYEYNGSGELISYNFSGPAVNSFTTPFTEPATSSSNISFSSILQSSISLSWTRGSGSSCIVLADAGAADEPVDGVEYSADADYTLASPIGSGKVVYVGSGNSVIVNNLSNPGSAHSFKIYEFNGSGLLTNYKLASPASSNATLLATNDVAMNVAATAVCDGFFFDPEGNSNYAHSKNVVQTFSPASGQVLKFDFSSFATHSANDLLSIYDGNATTAPLIGSYSGTSSPGVVVSTNSTGELTFKWVSNGDGNTTGWKAAMTCLTLDQEPTLNASGLTFTNVAPGSMTITWTSGNGGQRLLIGRKTSPVNFVPKDGLDYNIGAIGTSGNIIYYKGTGNSVTISSLTPSSVYHFTLYEYNNNNATAKASNYLISSAPTASKSTLATEPVNQPTSISFSKILISSLRLQATTNSSSGVIVAKAGNPVDKVPVDGIVYTANGTFGLGSDLGSGNYVVAAGNLADINISGLSANTNYHFAYFSSSGTGSAINYLQINPTLIDTATLNASDIVIATSSLSVCTAKFYDAGGKGNYSNNENYVLTLTPSSSGNILKIVFSTIGLGMGDNLKVYDGKTINAPLLGSNIDLSTILATNPDGALTIQFTSDNNSIANGWEAEVTCVDRSVLYAEEPTSIATGIGQSAVLNSSFNLTWVNGNGAKRIVVASLIDAGAFLPQDGIDYVANTAFGLGSNINNGNYVVYSGTGSSALVTNLSRNTSYNFAIYEFNGSGLSSNYLTKGVTKTKLSSANYTISLNPWADNKVCSGSILPISFTTTGSFASTSKFTAQISDAFGTFNGPVTIGTSTSSPISATFPILQPGTEYKIRIVSSAPEVISEGTFLVATGTAPSPVVTVEGNILSSNYSLGNQWLIDGNLIPGATNQQYEVTKSGSYSVKVSEGNCFKISDPVSVNDDSDDLRFHPISLFPNPATEKVTVQMNERLRKQAFVRVFNTNGQEQGLFYFDGKSGQNVVVLDVSNFSKGLFLLKVYNGAKVFNKVFLKE